MARVRHAALRSGTRFGELVRQSGPRAEAMATRDWTVAESAAHVLSLVTYYANLFDPHAPQVPVPDLLPLLNSTNVDTVRLTNAAVLRHVRERRPDRLADAIGRSLDGLMAATAGQDPERTVPWLGDSRVPAAGVLAHLTNEFLIHGWDIARGLGRPWPAPDADAALFFEEFLVGMIRHDYGVLLDHGARPPKRPISVRFESAFTSPVNLVLRDGRVSVVDGGGPGDARVRFRPASFNLMLFGRIGLIRALASRDVVVGGRRPWLLPSFLRFVHMPRN